MTFPGSVDSFTVDWTIVGASASTVFQFCQPEIQNFHPPVLGDENVFRLEVAMDDPLAVCGGQALGNLQRILRGLARRQRRAGHAVERIAQRLSFEQFVDQIRLPFVLAHVEHGQDVRVIQRREGLGLLFEPPQSVGVGRELLRQRL